MTTPIPLDTFSADLTPGESIEWTGQPNASVIFHQEDWGAIPFSLMWGGFSIFWFLAASGLLMSFQGKSNRPFEIFAMIWGTPFVLIGQYLIWGRFIYARWKKRRTYYALTNRRALIIFQGFRTRTSSSAWFESLSLIDKRVGGNGIGSISFGAPVTGEWQWGKNKPPRPPTFDDVDNADSVYQTALHLMEKSRAASTRESRWPT